MCFFLCVLRCCLRCCGVNRGALWVRCTESNISIQLHIFQDFYDFITHPNTHDSYIHCSNKPIISKYIFSSSKFISIKIASTVMQTRNTKRTYIRMICRILSSSLLTVLCGIRSHHLWSTDIYSNVRKLYTNEHKKPSRIVICTPFRFGSQCTARVHKSMALRCPTHALNSEKQRPPPARYPQQRTVQIIYTTPSRHRPS